MGKYNYNKFRKKKFTNPFYDRGISVGYEPTFRRVYDPHPALAVEESRTALDEIVTRQAMDMVRTEISNRLDGHLGRVVNGNETEIAASIINTLQGMIAAGVITGEPEVSVDGGEVRINAQVPTSTGIDYIITQAGLPDV